MRYMEQDQQLREYMSLIQELIYKDPILMIQKCYELKELAEKRNNTYCICFAQNYITDYTFSAKTHSEVMKQLNIALYLNEHADYDDLRLQIYNLAGIIYADNSNYNEAIEYYLKALSKTREGENNEVRSKIYTNLAYCFISLNQFEMALPYCEKAQAIYKELNRPNNHLYSIICTNLAAIYANVHREKEAITILDKLVNDESLDDTVSAMTLNKSIRCVCDANLQKQEEAMKLIDEIMDTPAEGFNAREVNYSSFQRIFDVAMKIHDKDRAKKILQSLEQMEYTYQNVSLKRDLIMKKIEYCHCFQESEELVLLYEAFYQLSKQEAQERKTSSVDTLLSKLKLYEEIEEKANIKKQVELARKESIAKSSFLSKMSHEIRTPLNAVIGYLSIAKNSLDNQTKVEHCLDNSEIAAKHLLQIINDVLDMSSIESGKLKIAKTEFDIQKLISDTTMLFYNNAKNKGVKFETHIDHLEEQWVVGDELRVNQILMNLISNAIKFTAQDGVVTLKISQAQDELDAQNVYVRFSVQDNGIGMSEEYLSRLFQPFEQESADTAKKYGGSGLGLSITNNLVQMMGGSMEVFSKQGEGTLFSVLLPFERTREEYDRICLPESFSQIRVLVADVDEDTGAYIKQQFVGLGVKCDTVNSGKKAIRRLVSRQSIDRSYDLCLIDWEMEDMDAVEVVTEIGRIMGNKKPLLVATSYDNTATLEEAEQVGVEKILVKPVFQSVLMELCMSAFGKQELKSEKKRIDIDIKGRNILLAEDNEMNMEIAVDVLTKSGIHITPVRNGREALDTFEQSVPNTFDAILMDIQMPEMDGYTATRSIRASNHPEAKSIPIIAITANAFAEDVAATRAAGMDDHISKPISFDKLLVALARLTK